MARIGVLDLVGERQILPDFRVTRDVGAVNGTAVFQKLLPELVARVELCEILVDESPGLFTVERIGPALGKLDLDLAVCDLVLELRRAPAGPPVEPQPVLHADGLGLGVVREDAGMGD